MNSLSTADSADADVRKLNPAHRDGGGGETPACVAAVPRFNFGRVDKCCPEGSTVIGLTEPDVTLIKRSIKKTLLNNIPLLFPNTIARITVRRETFSTSKVDKQRPYLEYVYF